jgi:hypothetical protein
LSGHCWLRPSWAEQTLPRPGVYSMSTISVALSKASLIRDHLLSAIAHGQGEMDWAGLARVLAEHAGLGEPTAMPHSMAH